MSTSILNDVKATLGISYSDSSFDTDIIIHINSVLSVLNQIGIGPSGGLYIENASTLWSALLGSTTNIHAVKTYICLRVRILFDPPQTSYLIEAMNNQVRELEWRLNAIREETAWTDPLTV